MKESYSDEIMLCFVQGYGDRQGYDKGQLSDISEHNLREKLESVDGEEVELRPKKRSSLLSGKSLRLSSSKRVPKSLPDVKRSFSDRFSATNDENVNGKRPRGLLTLRKTWSTGNFASSVPGGGCAAPRSAPATPQQLEPHPPHPHTPRPKNDKSDKSDKHVVKPLSNSAHSVRAAAIAGADASDASDGKAPSKARQKKFLRHFPQVGPDERVLNYYSCALVGDILLQGHLYITKNYFAFYSNVFGYVTKLLIPTGSVVRVTKEKMARIIPNAVGVCTRDERHVFGSLLSRDSTHKLMTRVWKAATNGRAQPPQPQLDLRISEAELDASEYSPEDESSSGGGDDSRLKRREPEAIVNGPTAAVIQPALLTGTAPVRGGDGGGTGRVFLLGAVVLMAMSATWMAFKLYTTNYEPELSPWSPWRGGAARALDADLQAYLASNLVLLAKVRQSLEALSSVILTDMSNSSGGAVDGPRDAFS